MARVPRDPEQQRDATAQEAAGALLQGARAAIGGDDAPPELHGVHAKVLEREVHPSGKELLRLQLMDGSEAEVSLVLSCPNASPPSPSRTQSKSSLTGQDTDAAGKIDGTESRLSFGSKESSGRPSRSGSKLEPTVIHSNFIKAEAAPIEEDDSWLRKKVRSVVESRAFEAGIAAAVILNFGLTLVETDASAAGKEPEPWLKPLLVVCFLCVIVEFCVRAYVERRNLFESAWTWLDIFVIFSGFLDYVIQMTGWGGIAVIRTLRIFRLFRLVRVVLHLKFFHELTKLLQMMGSCFRTLFWSFLLMGFVMTIWGTIAVEVVHPVILELIDEHGEFQDFPRSRIAFSSVLHADLTLFQTIIAGDSWGTLAFPVIVYKPWTGVIFFGSLLTLVFGVLNMIVAVVVDTSAEVRSKDIIGRGWKLEYEEVEEKRALTKMFHKIDANRNGSLSLGELKDGAKKVPEFRHWLRVLDIDASDLNQLFQMVDEDGSGTIEPHEFIEHMYRFKNAESKTASRFVKHQLTKLERHQVGFEETMKAKLEKVKSKVDGCESALATGFSSVKEGVRKQVLTTGLKSDEELHRRLSQQMDSMESAFQQATREALEIALRTAADTTRHLLEAASAANKQAALPAAEPPRAVEDAKTDPGEEAPAEGKGFWPGSWWAESLSPRLMMRLPSEDSKAECPPTTCGWGKDGNDDEEPAVAIVPEPWAGPPELEERGRAGDLEAPCQELRGPNGASTGPLRPFLPGGFQPRAPRPVQSPCDDLQAGPRSSLGAGLGPDLEKGGDERGRGSGADASAGRRAGARGRPASRGGRRGSKPSPSRD